MWHCGPTRFYMETRGLEALTRMLFFKFAIIIIGLSVWRLRPVNEIKRKWWTIFFYWKEREKLGCYDCFSIGLIWIVNSSAENFHLWTALQKMSNISLEGFYWYKDNLSGRRFFGENFQVPRNNDLAFESFPCNDDIYDCDIRSEKQTCGHTILK